MLPEEECREGESVEEFAERVRKNMADSLSVPLTEFTWSDKQELVKRLEEEEQARRQEEQSEYYSTTIHVPELNILIGTKNSRY